MRPTRWKLIIGGAAAAGLTVGAVAQAGDSGPELNDSRTPIELQSDPTAEDDEDTSADDDTVPASIDSPFADDEDGVGDGGIVELAVPIGHGQLAGDDHRAPAEAVVEDFDRKVPAQNDAINAHGPHGLGAGQRENFQPIKARVAWSKGRAYAVGEVRALAARDILRPNLPDDL